VGLTNNDGGDDPPKHSPLTSRKELVKIAAKYAEEGRFHSQHPPRRPDTSRGENGEVSEDEARDQEKLQS